MCVNMPASCIISRYQVLYFVHFLIFAGDSSIFSEDHIRIVRLNREIIEILSKILQYLLALVLCNFKPSDCFLGLACSKETSMHGHSAHINSGGT